MTAITPKTETGGPQVQGLPGCHGNTEVDPGHTVRTSLQTTKLAAFTAHTKAVGSVSSAHIRQCTITYNYRSKESNVLFWPLQAPVQWWYTYTHAGTHT